jgi:dCTP deaminase
VEELDEMSSLLSYNQLLKLLVDGVVLNSAPEFVNGASIDVTLGRELLLENHHHSTISLRDHEPLPATKFTMTDDKGYVLKPGEFVLACTQQIFNFPISLTGRFYMKSSAGRIGLEHLNSAWCDPGWHGSALTLELCNCARYTSIRIRPDDCIGQMTFQRVEGVPAEHGYGRRGRYNGCQTVEGAK